MGRECLVSEMMGKVLKSVTVNGDESIVFISVTGEAWKMYHYDDCCESVTIDDICGDINDLVGAPLLLSECVSSIDGFDNAPKYKYDESFTWTFYKFATIKGAVTICWYGTSNGCYSEEVSFEYIGMVK